MREQWNRQAITTQSNASPLPGCSSTPPFISLPSAAFNRLLPKRIASTSPFPPDRPFQCSITTPSPDLPRTPAPEEKYIEGRRKKNDSGERRFNSYVSISSHNQILTWRKAFPPNLDSEGGGRRLQQSNASPLPGCFSTPPFISLPSARLQSPAFPKELLPRPPFPRIVPSSVPSPPLSPPLPRTPAPEEKYIEGRRKEE
ncbi:hypothetical protein CEXT_395151 [Caerostris extrusa]|uniref:Uncharacterized protein n=1 Tax=Caerostris extrusa TaxID=172846 RepID=A0AAV4W904_CAEEX|nr:hypothetical protein CEXT_395151 [Caerostris extrusa]